jgi:PAS domain S-box-containing protein
MAEDLAVVVVDPDGRLAPVAQALRQGGIEHVRTVSAVDGLEDEECDCVLVPDDSSGDLDGLEYVRVIRDRLGDIPVGIYAFEGEIGHTVALIKGGADTVVAVPPEWPAVLAKRIRHLAGVTGTESLERQFESFLNHYHERVFFKDCEGQFVNATQPDSFAGFDIDIEQIIGLTDYALYRRDLADELFREEQELLAREERLDEKIEHYVENGEDRWVSTTKIPRYDTEGELLGLVGNVRDVTGIKRQERMMATLHEASRRLVRAETREEIASEAIDIAAAMELLPDARIDFFEAGALRSVARTNGDIEWDEQSFQRTAARGVTQYHTGSNEVVTVTDHDHRDLELPDGVESVRGLRMPLGEHGVFGVESSGESLDPFTVELAHVLASNTEAALDRATQERQLNEQAERLEEFAALSSHELRNRLQIALGTAERARAQQDVDAIDDVIETLGRMSRLVSQLLTLARTGSATRGSESIALSGISEVAWKAVDDETATLTVESDGIVTADRDGLLEVLEMVFRTVIEGGGSSEVRVGTLPDGFYVEDDDTGITPEQRADLLEPTHSDLNETTGDSVYLVATIAEAHNWDVSVAEKDGKTRFSFRNVEIAHVE